MSFNTKKCRILIISRQRLRLVPAYKIGPDHLTTPYLGVTISSDLRWNIHINNVCAWAIRTLNFIRRNIYRCPPDSKSLALASSWVCQWSLGSSHSKERQQPWNFPTSSSQVCEKRLPPHNECFIPDWWAFSLIPSLASKQTWINALP